MVEPFAGVPLAGAEVAGAGAGVEGAAVPDGEFHWIVEPESGVGDVKTGRSSASADRQANDENAARTTTRAESMSDFTMNEGDGSGWAQMWAK